MNEVIENSIIKHSISPRKYDQVFANSIIKHFNRSKTLLQNILNARNLKHSIFRYKMCFEPVTELKVFRMRFQIF